MLPKTLAFAAILALTLPAATARAQAQPPVPVAGCLVAQAHTHGCLATVVKGPGVSESGASATKEGRACAWNILNLVAVGDVRITTAKWNGQITQVSSVDYETFELIPYYGLFSRYCTVVSGS